MNRKWNTNDKLNKEKIEKYFCEHGVPITFHGESNEGRHVISPKFKNPEIERQKNALIEEGMKGERKKVDSSGKSLDRHFVYDGYGLSYSVEGVNDKGVFKENYWESYYGPRRELEKSQKENSSTQQETRDINLNEIAKGINQENIQAESSSNSNKKDQKSEKETNQQSSLQKKDNDNKIIYYGVGIASLILLLMSVVVVSVKKKKLK